VGWSKFVLTTSIEQITDGLEANQAKVNHRGSVRNGFLEGSVVEDTLVKRSSGNPHY